MILLGNREYRRETVTEQDCSAKRRAKEPDMLRPEGLWVADKARTNAQPRNPVPFTHLA